MRLTLVQLSSFVAKWRRIGLTDEDLQSLEEILLRDPESGDLIPGTGGLRKVRFGPPSMHRGKRGATREPSLLARRLLDTIKSSPSRWLATVRETAVA